MAGQMAKPSLEQARAWFEERFSEVHVYDSATHPPSLRPGLCPNGTEYLTVINGKLNPEPGGYLPTAMEYTQAVQAWLDGVIKLSELVGTSKYLWWRTLPEWNEGPDGRGSIYSR